ncbi:MAG: hypothetical protein RLZZ91_50 [Bacteroidota bacterium]
MTQSRVDSYLIANSKYFESHQVAYLRDKLTSMEDEKFDLVLAVQLREPSFTVMISLAGGSMGMDRFYLGQTGLGVAKLLTAGGCGIWTIVDWFTAQSNARKVNMENLQRIVG